MNTRQILFSIGLAIAFIGAALASDINKGYSFAPSEKNITHTKLNNLVDGASINTSFFTDKTASTAPASGDFTLIYSIAAADYRKISLSTLLFGNTNLITGQVEDFQPLVADYFLSYDTSAGALRKVNLDSMVFTNAALISGRTNWLTPNPLTTYLLAYDSGAWSKVNPSNLLWQYASWSYFTNVPVNTAATNGDILLAFDSTNNVNKQLSLLTLQGYVTNANNCATLAQKAKQPVTWTTNSWPVPNANTITNYLHGLPGVPRVRLVLVETNSLGSLGYAQGDEVDATGAVITGPNPVATVGANATTVFMGYGGGSGSWFVNRKDTGAQAAIPAKVDWNLKIYATYYP